MKILFLSQIIPWPLDAGPKVKTWNVLQHLRKQGHEIILFSFVRKEEERYLSEVREHFPRLYTVPIRRSRVADFYYLIRSLFSGRPFLVERDDFPAMRSLVHKVLEEEQIQFIHADQLTMVQYAYSQSFPKDKIKENGNKTSSPYIIFDAHNAVWTILHRMEQTASFWLKPFIKLEKKKVMAYEGALVQSVDCALTVSEIDRAALQQALSVYNEGNTMGRDNICVIPIVVNTQRLNPVSHQNDSFNILAIGSMHYPPNADGIRWFLNEVYPLVLKELPQATLTIVGKSPPADIVKRSLDFESRVSLAGYVEDLEPYFESAAVEVVPVRAGGGMRVRLLEAFSKGMPVVTTTIGLEGIEAEDEVQVIVRDEPIDFALAVVRLLQDETLQRNLGKNARELVVSHYDWQVALEKLDQVYAATALPRK